MLPATFFRIALSLPIALPLLLLPFGESAALAVLLITLAFGGAQYVAFAIWLFFVIGKKDSSAEIQNLSFLAPLLFVPIQAIGWVAWGYYDRLSNPELEGIWEPLLPFAVYTLVIGYLYVVIVNVVFRAFQKKGIVREI
jgi:hypothetical protein